LALAFDDAEGVEGIPCIASHAEDAVGILPR
jgi:hypothetical protein